MPTVQPAGVPMVALSDGYNMPQLGFGVWQVSNDEVVDAVAEAIRSGYTAIDTAQGYDNEEGVGRAIAQSEVDRENLFITSKIRTKHMSFEGALSGMEESLENLGLDYLDLFLIHWPTPARDTYVETWKGFIQARERGLIRSIGVSNFLPEHIERLLDETGVQPVLNQLETHPYFQQRDVRLFHSERGIPLEAYSPLGSGTVLKDETIGAIAKAHGRSPAQVIIRWHLQEGRLVIPKSVTPERIRSNIEVFDFNLTEQEMERIAGLDNPASGRTGSDPATFNDLY